MREGRERIGVKQPVGVGERGAQRLAGAAASAGGSRDPAPLAAPAGRTVVSFLPSPPLLPEKMPVRRDVSRQVSCLSPAVPAIRAAPAPRHRCAPGRRGCSTFPRSGGREPFTPCSSTVQETVALPLCYVGRLSLFSGQGRREVLDTS